jgi:hypothetical protein
MTQKPEIKLFDEKLVRTVWDDEQEKWYFCVVDVVEVLTDSPNPQLYWRVLKKRLLAEGNQEAVSKGRQPLFFLFYFKKNGIK